MAEAVKPVKKKSNKILWIMLLLFAALIAGYITLRIIKRRKQEKLLSEEEAKAAANTGSNTGSSNNSPSQQPNDSQFPYKVGSTGPNIKGIQLIINQKFPDAKLATDGIFGEETKAAIIKYFGADAYPVTPEAVKKIVSTPPATAGLTLDQSGATTKIGSNKTTTTEKSDFPLIIGSSNNHVTGLKAMINNITGSKLDYKDPKFDQQTYDTLITKIGTKYYPVTAQGYFELGNISAAKRGRVD